MNPGLGGRRRGVDRAVEVLEVLDLELNLVAILLYTRKRRVTVVSNGPV